LSALIIHYENNGTSAYVNFLCYRPCKPTDTTKSHYLDGVMRYKQLLNTYHLRNIAQIILSVFCIVIYILELLLKS